jgi:type IV pilus assembly protein PilY1
MKKHPNFIFAIAMMGFLLTVLTTPAGAHTEPTMADYTAYPIFNSQSVPPNIMIILDNSGSMNFNAYGTYPGDNGTVTDAPFTGEPYSGIKSFQVTSNQDDAEEGVAAGSVLYYNNGDLDLGGWSVAANDSIVGIRFQNVAIPKGVTIHSAYFEFKANTSNAETTNLLIEGEAVDDAAPFAAIANDLKNRIGTTATVSWDNVQAWTAGNSYPSPDITAIVQEIVDRVGWSSGNSMVFRLKGVGTDDNKRDIRAHDSSSTTAPRLHVVFGNDPTATRYYGYFNPDYFYSYSSGVFNHAYKKIGYDFGSSSWSVETLAGSSSSLSDAQIVSSGLWDGNWLNWLCMRRIDVLRKVLMGGLATARTGGGNQVNYGETPSQSWRVFRKEFDSTIASAVSPYDDNYSYEMNGGYIIVDGTKYSIRIQKDDVLDPDDFTPDHNLSGVLQRVGDKARWGNIWFNNGTGHNSSGGTVEHTIGTNMVAMVTDLQNTGCDTYTPLAESYYVAMQYFMQQDPAAGLDYPNNAVPNSNLGDDPWYNGTEYVTCAKSFVILLTDGASTRDGMIPSTYKDYDGDGDSTNCSEASEVNCDYPSGGTDFLDDLALYARTVDLRPDLEEEQNIILYPIYAFGNDTNARSLLIDAARNGGFEDKNGNDRPDLDVEWDENGDGVPDTFFEASDGYALEKQLLAAITDILKRAASGTSASVLATNSEGEGNMVQAYFRAAVTEGLEEAHWLGFLHSLWVDAYGVLHEDTNQNAKLDSADLAVEFVTGSDGDTKVMRNGLEVALEDIQPIFEAGKRLMSRLPITRRIFTYLDANNDNVVDEPSPVNMFDFSGEAISFESANAALIKPYLGVIEDGTWGDGAAGLGSTLDERVNNIIEWTRGTDIAGLRNRTLDGETWRLGDIVHSTPVSIAQAPDQYHTVYADESYLEYWNAVKNRETVIYVGSNDGMLHAFTSWSYEKAGREYVKPSGTTERIGDELWAYIPRSVLPHLKWTAHGRYTHTYLVDSKPRVFDAKILPDDTHYSDSDSDPNWGTFLVMGLNMGARHIDVEEDFGSGSVELRDFNPTYFMIDITEPRNPRLMWERTYADLSMSQSRPVPLKVDDKWYLAFGSGPTDYEGRSTQDGYLYVVDLATGQQLRRFGPLDGNALFNEPIAFDKNLNYNVDAIYAADAFFDHTWQGSVYKIAVPCTNCEWDSSYDPNQPYGYKTDPNNWQLSKMFESPRPISAPLSASVEINALKGIDNVWVYFGTGRYMNNDDIIDSTQQYLYGIKDPFFNSKSGSFHHDFGSAKTVVHCYLFGSQSITTTTEGHVLQGASLFGTSGSLNELETYIQDNFDGWYRELEVSGTGPSERIVSKPAVLGGMVFVPAFTPNSDICGFGGETTFYAVYYATGTGYTRQIFEIDSPAHVNVEGKSEEVVEVKLPESFIGVAPPSAGIHAGQEEGIRAFIQLSTGRVLEIDAKPPFNFRGAIIDWWEN